MARTRWAACQLVLAIWLAAAGADVVRGQDGPVVVLEDSLRAAGTMVAGSCPTGRNRGDFVGEGLRLQVTGRCSEGAPTAAVGLPVQGLVLTDGDVSFEFKAVGDLDRLVVRAFARSGANPPAGHVVAISRTRVALLKVSDNTLRAVAERTDLRDLVSTDVWTSVGLRLNGINLVLSLNGTEVLTVQDDSATSGQLSLGVARSGSLDDDVMTGAVFRNVRVSTVAGGDPARAPTYAPPAAAPTPLPTTGAFVPPPGTPPGLGDVVWARGFTDPNELPPSRCPTGRGAREWKDGEVHLWANGRCQDTASGVDVSVGLSGINAPDGELSFEFKQIAGADRALISALLRASTSPAGAYVFTVVPSVGHATIVRVDGPGIPATPLGSRTDIARLLRPGDWNAIAARVDHASLWMLINGQPVLSAQDDRLTEGNPIIGLARLGRADDDAEVSIALRNVRVSAIANGDPDRAPKVRPGGNGESSARVTRSPGRPPALDADH
ncbi:MAG: hypothetical protein U0821_15430 [Chloroflexota bacterium]